MDKIKFEELYLSCRTAVERFVYYKMASKSDAEDILQEVAIAAYKNISEVKKPESFKPWILKIASNKCNDFYRMIAKRHEIPFDETINITVSMSRYGISETEVVRDTLIDMTDKDKQILFLYYFKNKPQAEIAQLLKIPLGTVKSRLHTAKQNFKEIYPFPPEPQKFKKSKGEDIMKKLPDIMPEYKIKLSAEKPFGAKWEELPGWFAIPKLGEKLTWAIYEFADKKRRETISMQATGKAIVHGIEGVEISTAEINPIENTDVKHGFVIAQLTDTHCRVLAETHMTDVNVKKYITFLDGEDFLSQWGFGEDNCGKEINLIAKGKIKKKGNNFTCEKEKYLMDIVGRYDVEINGKIYDTVCLVGLEFENNGIFSEQYIDKNGRTVLWRRFNKNDWNYKRYNEHYSFDGNKLWSEMFPENEQITINGEIYVHWYDCITDYIF